jgi:hypothetical protein
MCCNCIHAEKHGNTTNMGIGRIQNEQLTGRLDKLKV